MTTDISILNMGLSKIAAGRITAINPARTPLERHCAVNYGQWRDNELTKRRWYFSLETVALTRAGDPLTGTYRLYKYNLPENSLRVIREKTSDWEQRGEFLYSAQPTLIVTHIKRVPEEKFTAPFIEVLACCVAMNSTEFATQSNTKGLKADQQYAMAVKEAAKVNAFVIGSESINVPDEESEWLSARWGIPYEAVPPDA